MSWGMKSILPLEVKPGSRGFDGLAYTPAKDIKDTKPRFVWAF